MVSNLILVFKVFTFHQRMFSDNLTHALPSKICSSLLHKATESALKFISFRNKFLYLIFQILKKGIKVHDINMILINY